MDERATQPKLLAHAARQFLGRTIGERLETDAVEEFRDPPFAFTPRLAEQAAEEFDVLAHAQVRI